MWVWEERGRPYHQRLAACLPPLLAQDGTGRTLTICFLETRWAAGVPRGGLLTHAAPSAPGPPLTCRAPVLTPTDSFHPVLEH